MPHTLTPPAAPTPADWTFLFHNWQTIVEDERHPLYAEACKISAAAGQGGFSPGALFCELVEAN
jgi:hypothetical protein